MFKRRFRNLVIATLMAASATMVAVLGGAAPASAAYGMRITLADTHYACLDSNYDGHVYLHGCNNGNFQRWYLNGIGLLRNVETGLCLESSGTFMNGRATVNTRYCNDGHAQRWSMDGGIIKNSRYGCYLFWNPVIDAVGCEWNATVWRWADWYRV